MGRGRPPPGERLTFVRQRAEKVVTGFIAAMSAFVRLQATDRHAGEIIFHVIHEEVADAIVKRRLIALHGQHVIGFPFHDLASDFGLASHGIDRDQTAG